MAIQLTTDEIIAAIIDHLKIASQKLKAGEISAANRELNRVGRLVDSITSGALSLGGEDATVQILPVSSPSGEEME